MTRNGSRKLTFRPGRSLRSCELVFEELRRQDPRQRPPQYYGIAPRGESIFPALSQSGSQVPQKRSLGQGEASASTARPLAPRTSTSGRSNGEGSLPPQPSPGDTTGEPARKKRGRPSKAELDQRRAAAEARGEVYQPPKRRVAKKQSVPAPTLGTPSSVNVPDAVPPRVATDPTQTPTRPAAEPGSEGSSGKRKRQKSKLDAHELSKMQIPAVLSSEPDPNPVPTVANPALLGGAYRDLPSTIPETQSARNTPIESVPKASSEQPSASPSSNVEAQPKTESSGTVQPRSAEGNETQQRS